MPLVKRGKSKFWYVQFQIDHQTIIRSTRTTDRKIAEQVAMKIRAEAHSEIILGKRKPATLEVAIEKFVSSKLGSANYRNLLSQKRIILKTISGSLPLSRISQSVLEDFKRIRTEQGCSSQTVKHGLNCIIGALRFARKSGFDCPEFDAPTIRVSNKRVRYLTVEEERRLLSELDPNREGNGLPPVASRTADRRRWMQDNYDLVIMLLDTGARYSEIANIRWDQIDLDRKSIRLWRSKVSNESVIFMTDRIFSILRKRLKSKVSEFVFSSKSGGPRGYSAIGIRKAMRRAGLTDCTIHTLRHTHATRLIQNGLNVYEVRSVLGHTDIRTTMRYAHLEQAVVTSRARDVINQLNGSNAASEIGER